MYNNRYVTELSISEVKKYYEILRKNKKLTHEESADFGICKERLIEYAYKNIDKAESKEQSKEQESVLDKISAEIMQLDYDIETVDHDYDYRYPHLNMAQIEEVHLICREEVLQIINEYKEKSEE